MSNALEVCGKELFLARHFKEGRNDFRAITLINLYTLVDGAWSLFVVLLVHLINCFIYIVLAL